MAYPKLSGGNVGGGVVRTCYYDGDPGGHFDACNSQLTVNGAIVAEKILFGRVYGSLKQDPILADSDTTNAAEIINLLPEYFIGIPELPLFPDKIYRTDSLSTKPVNF